MYEPHPEREAELQVAGLSAWEDSCVLTPSGAGAGHQVKVLALFLCLVST